MVTKTLPVISSCIQNGIMLKNSHPTYIAKLRSSFYDAVEVQPSLGAVHVPAGAAVVEVVPPRAVVPALDVVAARVVGDEP
jgi:hypothetical protein